jgi:hypothetical protein
MNDYLRFPLKWFNADLQSIRKVKYEEKTVILCPRKDLGYFGDVTVWEPNEYKFKVGQIGWEVLYINKRRRKIIVQIWTEVDESQRKICLDPEPIFQWGKHFGMVLSKTEQM